MLVPRHRIRLDADSVYLRVLHNRALMLLWGGQSVSIVGDAFFNLAVMWVVYAQSGSALQTSLVQVVWHLDRILFGPIAGIFADRHDRARIMVTAAVCSAAVAGALAGVALARGQAPSAAIFIGIFLLNSLHTFAGPASASIMPEMVGRDLLATASGLFSTIGGVASLLGNALAGIVVAALGAAWALAGDAASFLVAAIAIVLARLPSRIISAAAHPDSGRPSLPRELREGWQAIADQPVVRALVWLGMLINVASFLGPLYPALVSQRLHGNAAAFGAIEAAGVAGGMVGGALAGPLERRLSAGRVLIGGWGIAGACILGIAASTWLPMTAVLMAAHELALTAGAVANGALSVALIPERFRGRAWGLTSAAAAVSIPFSSLLAGWLADRMGAAPLFAIGGVFIVLVAALALSNRHIRAAHI